MITANRTFPIRLRPSKTIIQLRFKNALALTSNTIFNKLAVVDFVNSGRRALQSCRNVGTCCELQVLK